MRYFEERAKVLDYVGDDIKPVYFENIVAYVIDNFSIEERTDIPQLFGVGTPVQAAFENYIMAVIGKKGE